MMPTPAARPIAEEDPHQVSKLYPARGAEILRVLRLLIVVRAFTSR